jgi:beta-glucosidase
MTGVGGWEGALEKARAFVDQLTIEEKADMVTGQAGPCVGNIGKLHQFRQMLQVLTNL